MKLELPNFFTGYAMLLDADHKVRWQASGRALPDEVESLFRCTNELLEQEAIRRTL